MMQRRKFLKSASIVAVTPALHNIVPVIETNKDRKEFYEWRIYTLEKKEDLLDSFFKEALIPAYNRQNIPVGAFSLYKKREKEFRFLLFIYPDLMTFHRFKKDIWKDQEFVEKSRSFYESTAPDPVYPEFESYLCESFDHIPRMRQPDKDRTLFELRHYHSPNEEANQRKVKMFNKDEIAIFDQVKINSVCYGEVLAGPHMPALMYLTWYKDETARNEAWKKFSQHPEWVRIKNLPEYAYTATNNTNRLLSPMPYSQI